MVITSRRWTDGGRVRGASHFPSPENNCLVEQATLFQIDDEGRDGLFRNPGILFVELFQLAMLIPRRIVAVKTGAGDLNKSDARFNQTPGSQSLQRIQLLMFVGGIESIQFLNVFRFTTDIRDVRNGTLHQERCLVIGNGPFNGFRVG